MRINNNEIERDLMNQEEFEDYLKDTRYSTFDSVQKFKSSRRAIKRGHVHPNGIIYPNKPYNNRGNSCTRKGKHSRAINEDKKIIYKALKEYGE